MTIDIAHEYSNWIKDYSLLYHVDPLFIAAIRMTEQGSLGREFGVLSVPNCDTYQQQLEVCIHSVRNRLLEFASNPLVGYLTDNKHEVLGYSEHFIQTFANRWAPPKVTNDPNDLNQNWFGNCIGFYKRFITREGVI